MNLTLKVWRQKNNKDKGGLVTYQVKNISSEMSFLEMFDVLNEQLIEENQEPIAFDHDCREGICGMCSMYINGRPHGPWHGTTTCQLHMRAFKDGDTIVVEPWRAQAFPVIKDLVVASGDAIMEAYKSDKNAVKHEVNYSTTLNTINIKGGRTEHSVLSGTDNTGMRVQVATDIRGLKATIAAKKKQIFDATR